MTVEKAKRTRPTETIYCPYSPNKPRVNAFVVKGTEWSKESPVTAIVVSVINPSSIDTFPVINPPAVP